MSELVSAIRIRVAGNGGLIYQPGSDIVVPIFLHAVEDVGVKLF
jgi:hypothetical protein